MVRLRLMKRAIPWVVAVVATIAFGASFSELQRVRRRFGEVTRHQFNDHQDVRQFIIRAALAGLDSPIVVIGDSIAEMARFPEEIGGHPVVNAGIGGATIQDFETIAPSLLEHTKPFAIVIELGTNGPDSIGTEYVKLLEQLKNISQRLIAVGIPHADSNLTNDQIRSAASVVGVYYVNKILTPDLLLSDHIHLGAAGYKIWTPTIVSAIRDLVAKGS